MRIIGGSATAPQRRLQHEPLNHKDNRLVQVPPRPETADDLEILFSISARKILSNPDPQAFAAWFRESAPVIAGGVFPKVKGNEHANRAM